MSLGPNGKYIICDGEGCQATAAVPIGLRPSLTPGEQERQTVEGWLFVIRHGASQHFCPRCIQRHLKALSDGNTIKDFSLERMGNDRGEHKP
jgi:hypothetical protein